MYQKFYTGQALREKRVVCHARVDYMAKALSQVAEHFDDSWIVNNPQDGASHVPDVVIDSHRTVREFRRYADKHNVYLLATRHGSANKYIGPDQEFAYADYFCGSQWDREDCTSHGVHPRLGFLNTGNPWVDSVFRIPRRELNSTCPTILFAPTWNEETSSAFFFGADLYRLLGEAFDDFRLVVKFHPATLHAARYEPGPNAGPLIFDVGMEYVKISRKLVGEWKALAAEHDNLTFVEDTTLNIATLYPEADLLISDGSSLIWEFMALERPILMYQSGEVPAIWQMRQSDQALAHSRMDVGFAFSSLKEFTAHLPRAFEEHRSGYLANQRREVEELYGEFRDGRNIDRLVQAIRDLPPVHVAFGTEDGKAAQQPEDTGLLEHYRNIELDMVPGLLSMDDSQIASRLPHGHRDYVVLTNIPASHPLFSSCYIGEMRAKACKTGMAGFCALRLSHDGQVRWDHVERRLNSITWGEPLSPDGPHAAEPFDGRFYFLCIKRELLQASPEQALSFALPVDVALWDVRSADRYAKYAVTEVCPEFPSAKVVGKGVRDLLAQGFGLAAAHHDECLKQMRILDNAVVHFEEWGPDRVMELLVHLGSKNPTFGVPYVCMSRILIMANMSVRAMQTALDAAQRCPRNRMLRWEVSLNLRYIEVSNYYPVSPNDKGFSPPFGYVDFPSGLRVFSGITRMQGWVALDQGQQMLVFLDGELFPHWQDVERDDVVAAYRDSYPDKEFRGCFGLIDTEELQDNAAHTVDIRVWDGRRMVCVSRRTYYVRNS